MTLADLRRVVELLPDGGALTLTKALLLELVGVDTPEAASPAADLTVRELAHRLHRAPSTVRGWCEAGRFEGAYKLNGRDWRVTAESLNAFLAAQRARHAPSPAPAEPVSPEVVDLGAWRRVREHVA